MNTHVDATIRRVLAGDTDCYAEIVFRYQRDVTHVIAAMMFDRQESEDLVQQVFIAAYEQLDRFQLGQDMGPWLKGIARNVVRMHLRGRQTRERHLQLYQDWLLARYDNQAGLEFHEARLTAMQECLSGLPEHSRSLVDLRYRQQLAIAVIGQQLGKSIDAITKSLSRIREALRNCIQERTAAT